MLNIDPLLPIYAKVVGAVTGNRDIINFGDPHGHRVISLEILEFDVIQFGKRRRRA